VNRFWNLEKEAKHLRVAAILDWNMPELGLDERKAFHRKVNFRKVGVIVEPMQHCAVEQFEQVIGGLG
jgi:hypothetical protein